MSKQIAALGFAIQFSYFLWKAMLLMISVVLLQHLTWPWILTPWQLQDQKVFHTQLPETKREAELNEALLKKLFKRLRLYKEKLNLILPGANSFYRANPFRRRQNQFWKLLPLNLYCLFVLRFYGPVNPMGSCRARSVYLTTRLLGRVSPLGG